MYDNLEIIRRKFEEILLEIEKNKFVRVDGKLTFSKKGDKYSYYLCKRDDGKLIDRQYIRHDEIHIAKNIANDDYLRKAKDAAEKSIDTIDRFIDEFELNAVEKVYDNLKNGRKILVDPVDISYKEYCQKWKSEPYNRHPVIVDTNIYTENGENVRSKSEALIANLLKKYGIIYKYECPVRLNKTIYWPDFTIIHPITRQKVFWEHNGMMHSNNYVDKTIVKIKNYEMNGIRLGERLIVTFESPSEVLDMKYVESIIKDFLSIGIND